MKQIIFALLIALTCCTWAHAESRTVTEKDSLGNKKRIIELRDTLIEGKSVVDTLSITTYDDNAHATAGKENPDNWEHHHDSGFHWGDMELSNASETIIAVTAIVFVFGLPTLVVLIVFFFRHKNRKAKYRLMEQALASGQPLPENFLNSTEKDNLYSKAIKNIFTGIGLFIFFWAITKNFGVGCIGLLIMFTGFGQLVIHYGQKKKDD